MIYLVSTGSASSSVAPRVLQRVLLRLHLGGLPLLFLGARLLDPRELRRPGLRDGVDRALRVEGRHELADGLAARSASGSRAARCSGIGQHLKRGPKFKRNVPVRKTDAAAR